VHYVGSEEKNYVSPFGINFVLAIQGILQALDKNSRPPTPHALFQIKRHPALGLLLSVYASGGRRVRRLPDGLVIYPVASIG